MGPDVILVANPHAGGGRAVVLAERAAATMSGHGLTSDLLLSPSLDALRVDLAEAARRRPRAVIACGGDGTVHHVLQAALAADIPLGILPGGTGNDIARSLGIPIGPLRKGPLGTLRSPGAPDAWATTLATLIRSGQPSRVDVTELKVEGRTHQALAIVATGFDSAVNERANGMTRLRGTARYVAAVLAELRDLRTYTCDMSIDGVSISGEALLIAVGNGATYGGGMRICPDADMTDGHLDVTWVDAAPRRTILRVFPRIFSGSHVDHPLVRTSSGARITIDAPGAMVYADGERIGPAPVVIAVRPAALQVWRPESSSTP